MVKSKLPMTANNAPVALVVDDDEGARGLIQLHLRAEGFQTFVADGGKAAVTLAANPMNRIDILITDILMPHMNGWDLANRISRRRPGLKVLFVSAYSSEILSVNRLCPPGADLIRKPFSRESLVSRVARVFAGKKTWKDMASPGTE
jgi:DNA-binding response OmpR family regulator